MKYGSICTTLSPFESTGYPSSARHQEQYACSNAGDGDLEDCRKFDAHKLRNKPVIYQEGLKVIGIGRKRRGLHFQYV